MRLGQLARQVGVSPKEVLRKLQNDFNVEIKAHPNAKIPDDILKSLTKAFGQVSVEEQDVEIKVIKTGKETKTLINKGEVVHKLVSIVESIVPNEVIPEKEALGKMKTEIPTLEGPKIIGKIEISEIDLRRIAERNAERLEKPVRIKRPKKRPVENKKNSTKRKSNDSLEEKKNKETIALAEKRKKSADSLKELNKKKYSEKSITQSVPKTKKKKNKKKPEPDVIRESVTNTKKKKSTSVIGKLWSWLNDA